MKDKFVVWLASMISNELVEEALNGKEVYNKKPETIKEAGFKKDIN